MPWKFQGDGAPDHYIRGINQKILFFINIATFFCSNDTFWGTFAAVLEANSQKNFRASRGQAYAPLRSASAQKMISMILKDQPKPVTPSSSHMCPRGTCQKIGARIYTRSTLYKKFDFKFFFARGPFHNTYNKHFCSFPVIFVSCSVIFYHFKSLSLILSILSHFQSFSTIFIFYSYILAKGVRTLIVHTSLAKIYE